MSRGPSTFKQRDVTAAIKAAVAAGVEVAKIEVDKDGKIVMTIGKCERVNGERAGRNEWDDAV